MRDIILNQAQQITHSLEVNKNVRVTGDFDEIIVAGMGGSALPGDLLLALDATKIPLRIHRSYGLPRIFGKQPLIIISTYSGNTEESLSAYEAARAAGYSLLVNTAGGKAADWAARDNVPVVNIDLPGMQPRHTLLGSCSGLVSALSTSGLVDASFVNQLADLIPSLEQRIPELEAPAQTLATDLKDKIPVYLSSQRLAFAAKNFKIQTNENVKVPAFWNELPEMNHNEMVGFSHAPNPSVFQVVMLRDNDDHPRIKARMDITTDLYREWGISVSSFELTGSSLLEKLVYSAVSGLWLGFHLAEAYGIDPVPVAGVENFKKKLELVVGSL